MIYKTTQNCIQETVRSLGTISVEQLVRLFRSAPDADNVEYYLKELIGMSVFEYSRANNWVRYHGAPGLKEDFERRRVMAFWIVADFGYDNVREVIPLQYPAQLLFITEDNDVFDITVCVSEKEAVIAAATWSLTKIEGVEDEVNHIALVRDPEVGKAVLKYGFDSYCILDEDKKPQYFTE